MNKPEVIIIHHSLTRDNFTLDNFTAIKNYHMNTNKWRNIGYHRVIERDKGVLVVKQGRKDTETGAHCKEKGMNSKSIGLCVVGNFDLAPPDDALLEFVAKEVIRLRSIYGNIPVEPHNKYATYKSCAGKLFPMDKLRSLCEPKIVSEVDLAKQKIQSKCGLNDATMQYLSDYKFADALFVKIANQIK